MTRTEYLAILKRLDLGLGSVADTKATAKVLGVSPRMAQYYATGTPLSRLAIVRLLKRIRHRERCWRLAELELAEGLCDIKGSYDAQ
jgi:hypothetical protein